jgi:hypothetical protein
VEPVTRGSAPLWSTRQAVVWSAMGQTLGKYIANRNRLIQRRSGDQVSNTNLGQFVLKKRLSPPWGEGPYA